MAKNKETKAAPTYERRKVSVEFVKLRELKEADEKFIGTFLGQVTIPSTDMQGLPSSYERLFFIRRDEVSLAPLGRVAINSDAGLVSTMRNALVKENETVEIEWMGKTEHGNSGQTVNQYELYSIPSAPALGAAHALPLHALSQAASQQTA